MLYNLTLNVSAFFSLSGFRNDFCDVTVTSMWFLHAGQGNSTVSFSGYFLIYFLQSILEMRMSQNSVSSPEGVSEQIHETLPRVNRFCKTYR